MNLEGLKQHITDGFNTAKLRYNQIEDKIDKLASMIIHWRITTALCFLNFILIIWLAFIKN